MVRAREDASPGGLMTLILLSIVLSCAIYGVFTRPAQMVLGEQEQRLRQFERRIDAEKAENRRLRTLRNGLAEDPQTVERELRRWGWGRYGDLLLARGSATTPEEPPR